MPDSTDVPDVAEGLRIAAPVASESRQPVLATDTDVTGVGGTVLIDFFYVAPNTWLRVRSPSQPDVDHADGVTTLRSEPVARVALPLTTALDLMATLFEMLEQEMGELQASGSSAGQRIAEAGARMTSMTTAKAVEGDDA